MRRFLATVAAGLASLPLARAEDVRLLSSLNSAQGVTGTMEAKGAPRGIEAVTGAANSTDGDGALRLSGTTGAGDGNHYFGIMVPLAPPVDLRAARLLLDARTSQPGVTKAFYVRLYNKGEAKPAWSFNSWGGELRDGWRTFSLQAGLTWDGLQWEPDVVEARTATAIDRIEIIIGSGQKNAPVDVTIDNLRRAPRLKTLRDLTEPKPLVRDTVLVRDGKPEAVILHPDSVAGRAAAAAVAAAIKDKTGAVLACRPGTPEDRTPGQTAIMLGSVDTNPALLLLYARYQTPVDSVCPGAGGALVQTVHDPFGKGSNVVVLGAGDDAGLAVAVSVFRDVIGRAAKGRDLILPHVFERRYGKSFLERFAWAGGDPSPKRLADGLSAGQRVLDEGGHTSIAGQLAGVANRYQLTGHSVEAKLFVALWDLYVESAKADPRKFGGAWGFDSDFPSGQVAAGWDVIEEDPGLTDEERLRVTKAMARWLAEAVIPKCQGLNSTAVPFNHQTFPQLGALFGGLYFTQGWEVVEGKAWLRIADTAFHRQAGNFKVHEDCNGYQWLSNGHLLRYAVARPDFTVFENGNGRKIIDYCIGTMNNLGYQVPYGDTGSWQCWNSEMICLDIFAFVTGAKDAAWAANLKRELKKPRDLYAFYRTSPGEKPTGLDGVRVWPLEPRYLDTFPDPGRPPAERCFDKVSFREALEPQAAYLLLDALSNGGHKHLDGNAVLQLTQYERIWLADNDYFKSPVKFHNSMIVFRDGQAADIPQYAELLGAGESPRCGWSRTRMNDYAGADWDRTVVWLKALKAFVVLDRLTARTADEYQFRLRWHGVGEARLADNGLYLAQKGPSLWIQTAPGPQLSLVDDDELGQNWKGYEYAEPVVRSMTALATVRLGKGESYLFATALHGTADGEAKPWSLAFLDGTDGVRLTTDSGDMVVALGPATLGAGAGPLVSDAQVVVLDKTELSLLGAKSATASGTAVYAAAQPGSVDMPVAKAGVRAEGLKTRAPTPNAGGALQAPAHRVVWEKRPLPTRLVLTNNQGVPGRVDLGVKVQTEPAPAAQNVFGGGSPNTAAALFDGDWASNTSTSVMYDPDKTVTLTVDLGAVCRLDRVRWMQWWATTSSKNTSYLLDKAVVAISSDGFAKDRRELGTVTDAGPHGNFGAPIEYTVPGGGASARQVRLTVTPKPGSAVYLSEFLVEGAADGVVLKDVGFGLTRVIAAALGGKAAPASILAATAQGPVFAFGPDGTSVWTVEFPDRINDLAAADLNGDGKDEIVVARQDHFVTVLDAAGKEVWSRELKLYRRPPYVNVVRTGDLDGDGRPEVIAGGENWRFYAYKADGTELWNFESVHPSRSGAVADLDGDGKAEVMCGTHYYWFPVLNPDGTKRWSYHFGPICYDVTTGAFDGDKTRGVVLGSGDGCLHYLDKDGKVRLKYNTGDEVRKVAAVDVDGDGRDEILAGSVNYSLYCFGADTKRRWRVDVGAPVSALRSAVTAKGTVIVAGSAGGRVLTLDGTGKILAVTDLKSEVVDIATAGDSAFVATGDGTLRRVVVLP